MFDIIIVCSVVVGGCFTSLYLIFQGGGKKTGEQ